MVFVDAQWLYDNWGTTMLFDCRADIADPRAGITMYFEGHVKSAVFVDGEKKFCGRSGYRTGRHPLPDFDSFEYFLDINSLKQTTNIVLYGLYAARGWMLLKMYGFENVYLLDGSFEAWRDAGFEVEKRDVMAVWHDLKIPYRRDESVIVKSEEMVDIVADSSCCLIDARSKERFLGINEPIDPVAGHIQGAENIFWKDNFVEGYKLKPREELVEIWKDIAADKPVVHYCGSGVTACWNMAVMEELGYKSRIYVGSWSEWISRNLHLQR